MRDKNKKDHIKEVTDRIDTTLMNNISLYNDSYLKNVGEKKEQLKRINSEHFKQRYQEKE